ncbi:MAG: SGNH/GDSL hydrolase family protein, partial [Pseudomonadota bacterium]
MNYQKLVCWGDSQTFGARTYGCYPMHLVRILNEETRYTWITNNLSENGLTARDLWFRIAREVPNLADFYSACLLIG